MTSPADQGIEAARRDARTVSPAPETVTFSKAEVIDTDSKDTEITIYHDGVDVGYIQRESANAATGPGRGWYPRWVASSYDVVFLVGPDSSLDCNNNNIKDKYFHVEDYGHPRTALAAAKRYARATLNREGA